MKSLSVCTFLAMLAAPVVAHAADAKPTKPKMDPLVPDYSLHTKVFDFPTGLRIMFQADHSHPIVSIFSMVNHGSADDPDGKEEVAHFVEHTWFRSKHGDLPPIMDVIQDLGTLFNATTRNDWTDYRTVASNEYLPIMLRLESLRLTEPYKGVTEAEIDVEREVIRNEWRRRNEQSTSQLLDYLYGSVYPQNHGYHGASTHETIDQIKLADLQAYMDEYYRADTTTITVVGDFDPADASSLIFENFDLKLLHDDLTEDMLFKYPKEGIENPDQSNPDHWRTGAWDPATYDPDPNSDTQPSVFEFVTRGGPRITEQRPPLPELGSAEVRYEKGPLDYPYVLLGWSGPGGYRADHWNLQVAGNLAGRYIQRGFPDEIRDKKIRDIGCFALAEIQNSTFMCYIELVDPELDPERVAQKALDQFAEIWNPENLQNPFARNQLERSKQQALSDILLSLDLVAIHFGGRAEDITPTAHYTGDPKAHSTGMNQVMAIDGMDAIRTAAEVFKRDRAAIVVVEPIDEDEIDRGSENSSYEGANATDQVIRASDDLSTLTDEQIAESYIVPDLSDLIDFELDNGLRVVVLPHGEAPTVGANLIFRGGRETEEYGLYDFVQSFTRSVGHDTLQFAGSTNYFFFDGFGIMPPFAQPMSNGAQYTDAWRMNITAPSGNLENALWVLREEVESAAQYVSTKPDFLKRVRRSLKTGWANIAWHVLQHENAFLYGEDHPAGHLFSWEDTDTWAKWGPPEVTAYIKEHIQPANATLLIVGNIDGAEAKKQAQQYFGGWKPKNNAPDPSGTKLRTPNMPTEDSKILMFHEANRTQSQVNTTCRLNYSDPKQDPAVYVLGSLMRNKAFSTLRVGEGLAYSPGGYASVSPNGSAVLGFYSLAVNGGVGRTIEYFHQAMDEVISGDLSDEEVKLHKLRRARSSGVASQSTDQMTERLTSVIRKGAGWDLLTDQGEHIAAVDRGQLEELLEGCKEHTITTIQGPKEILTPQLDERGYAYEIIEWEAAGDELLWTHDPKAAKKRERNRIKDEKKKARKGDKEEEEEEEEDSEGSADSSN